MLVVKVGDSIEEVYCNVAVKLSGNIMVHALLGNICICDIVVKFYLILSLFRALIFKVKIWLIITII